MSQLTRLLHTKPIFQVSRLATAGQIKQCHWFPDYKPGPYPKTEAERKAAANKYNLLPDEYTPYPDDGDGMGDYPKLSYLSIDSRDPNHVYDQPQLRRDFKEPLHAEAMSLVPEAVSTDPPLFSHTKGTISFFAIVITLGSLVYYYYSKYYLELPIVKKEYPATGKKFYTFEIDHGLSELSHRGISREFHEELSYVNKMIKIENWFLICGNSFSDCYL